MSEVFKTDSFDVQGFVEQRQELDKLLMSNPAMEKKVQALIKKVLADARKNIGKAAGNVMEHDPRQAYKAVRIAVYKRILGGNVNILNKKNSKSGGGNYTPTRTLKTNQRGGNRRLRSSRTNDLESYFGASRGFVLRFLNAGTSNRVINFTTDENRESVHRGSQGGNLKKYGKTINTGFRGKIAPRNFFGNSSQRAMEMASNHLNSLIDELIKETLR